MLFRSSPAWLRPPFGSRRVRQQQAPSLPYTPHRVTSGDSVTLAVQEWGNRSGSAILFIHGSSQSHFFWGRQVEDPALQREFRLVIFDLRGHGASEKPVGDAFFKPAKPMGG